jgi:hypothetical protein
MDNIGLILGCVGLVYIITRSYITQSIRTNIKPIWLQYMLNCPQCIGFWVGILAAIPDNIILCILHGGLISLLSSFCVLILELLTLFQTYLIKNLNFDSFKLDNQPDDE